jgi:surfactin synthase thioesterase subunit
MDEPIKPDNLHAADATTRTRQNMTITSVPRARLTDDALIRLVCIPYAGGGTAVFHRWQQALPKRVDLVPLCLPGHDGRLSETLHTDIHDLAGELADDLCPALDRPYMLLGHSLGAWIAFEMARELRRRNARSPEMLIVAAARAPDTPISRPPLHLLSDPEFIAAIHERYDGIPAAVLASPELLAMLTPVLRADFRMGETYRYRPEMPLDVEILALGGAEDPAVSATQLAAWHDHTVAGCSVRLFPGGHFFLFRSDDRDPGERDEPSAPLRTIIEALKECLTAN